MARKYEFKSNQHAWIMERCEDRMLIAVFQDIEARVAPDQTWKRDFTDHFYLHGNPISGDYFAAINSVRRRLILPSLDLQETNIYDYGRLSDRARKAELRRQMRDEYVDSDTASRLWWRQDAEEQIAALPQPHYTLEEWKHERRRRFGGAPLTESEIVKRVEAVAQSRVQVPVPMPDDKGRAIRQLKLVQTLADNDALVLEVLSKIKPNDALDIAPEFDDPGIRTALIRHSLAG